TRLMNIHVRGSSRWVRPFPILPSGPPNRLCFAQAGRLQFFDLLGEMKRQLSINLPAHASRPQRIANPARPAHHCASASTRATPSVNRRQLCCSVSSCLRPLAVIEYNPTSRFFSIFPHSPRTHTPS